jgi:Mce-associated membrane protein
MSRPRWRARVANVTGERAAAVAVGAVVLLLIGLGVQQRVSEHDLHSHASQERAAAAAAKTKVLALTTLSASSTDRDIARLLKGVTPSFRAQFQDQAQAFRQALISQKVESTGVVNSVGVSSLKGKRATVIVAAVGTVTNARSPKPQQRAYRLKLEMRRVGSAWLVNAMEFVA